MSTPESNKAAVRKLFEAFRSGDLTTFDELILDSYVQHNPNVVNGREPVKEFFAQMGPIDVVNHRIFAEGDFVVAHSHYKTFNMAGVDIWRFDADGKIVEHWDVLQTIPPTTASGNDMFSQLT